MRERRGIRQKPKSPKVTSNGSTLPEAIEDFYLDCRARHLAPATLKYYKSKLGLFARYCAAQQIADLAALNAAALKRYLLSISERGCGTMTVNAHARAVRAFLNYCRRDNLLDESPFARIKLPAIDRDTKSALSEDEIRTALKATDNLRDYALILFLLDTGVRSSELRAIPVADLDQQERSVLLRHTKARKQRTCYIAAKTLKAIRKYLGSGSDLKPQEPLFAARLRGHLTPSGIEHIMRKLTKASGVHVTAHALRRTCAISMLRNGASIYHVQRQLGHKGIEAGTDLGRTPVVGLRTDAGIDRPRTPPLGSLSSVALSSAQTILSLPDPSYFRQFVVLTLGSPASFVQWVTSVRPTVMTPTSIRCACTEVAGEPNSWVHYSQAGVGASSIGMSDSAHQVGGAGKTGV